MTARDDYHFLAAWADEPDTTQYLQSKRQIRSALDEIDRLRQWKAEASAVLRETLNEHGWDIRTPALLDSPLAPDEVDAWRCEECGAPGEPVCRLCANRRGASAPDEVNEPETT